MNDFFGNSIFAGVTLSLLAYLLGDMIKKKFKMGFINPLLVSIIVSIIVLIVGSVDYEVYYEGAKYLSYLLTPATVCLAIPLYEQWEVLKKNYKAVICGLLAGVLTSVTTVFILSLVFNLSHEEYVTLLPKSITTAIGMGVSEELGGYVTITVAVASRSEENRGKQPRFCQRNSDNPFADGGTHFGKIFFSFSRET